MPSEIPPPTLEQLASLLAAVQEARATREAAGERTHFVFTVDNEALSAIGGAFYASGPAILAALQEALGRLLYFDGVTKDYAGVDQKGMTAADCQAFIANELKHVPPTHDLESNLRRRMFNATMQKLVELGVWRSAADARRFQNQREAERKRRKQEEDMRRKQDEWAEKMRQTEEEIRQSSERMRRQQEERMRQQEERMRQQEERMRQKAERERRESAAGSERHSRSRQKENPFGFDFESDPFGADFQDAFRDAGRAWRDQYESAFYGGNYRAGDSYQGYSQSQSNQKTKARNKGRAPWHEVLGVPPNADKATIKSAWRKLASALHPDKPENRNDPAKAERLKDVNTAKDEGIRGLA